MGDGGTIGGFEVRDGERDFLIESHDLEPFGSSDGEAGVEEIDGVRFARDVKIIKVAEKLRGSFPDAEPGAGASGRFLIDRFEHFESRGDALAFFVEYQGTVFHAACGEEADIAVTRELLRSTSRRDVGDRRRGRVTGGGANRVKMIGDERFVGDEEE